VAALAATARFSDDTSEDYHCRGKFGRPAITRQTLAGSLSGIRTSDRADWPSHGATPWPASRFHLARRPGPLASLMRQGNSPPSGGAPKQLGEVQAKHCTWPHTPIIAAQRAAGRLNPYLEHLSALPRHRGGIEPPKVADRLCRFRCARGEACEAAARPGRRSWYSTLPRGGNLDPAGFA